VIELNNIIKENVFKVDLLNDQKFGNPNGDHRFVDKQIQSMI